MQLKILLIGLSLLVLTSNIVYADASTSAPLNVTGEDGSPTTYPWQLRFPNGSITDNLDGTTSIAFTGSLVPNTRNLTINGTTYDLSADRTWTISTITGNAGTATALATARTINGTNFDGTSNIIVPVNLLTNIALCSLLSVSLVTVL